MKYTYKYSILFILLLITHLGKAQSQIRKLPSNINLPSVNLYAPAVSGDGESMIYLSDYSDDGSHIMYYVTKKSVSSWNEPVEVTKLINKPFLNYRGGYCLSFEGDMLLFTSRKSGLGGFELWYSTKVGSNWGPPQNFGSPINSASNEGTPSLSPDGQFLYFMRCDRMTEVKGASGCSLYVAQQKYGKWLTPEALPSHINNGNSQNPKILADGRTLIFSSDQLGGKGGLDLYMTTLEGGSWSKPIAMDFLNTAEDDQFISIPAKGQYMYTSIKDNRDNELVELLIPEEFQPTKVMRIKGKVVDKLTGEPINANLIVFNIESRDRLWNDKIGDKGEFALVLNEGNNYDFSIAHDNQQYMFYSKLYALEKIGNRDKQTLKIELAPIAVGDVHEADIIFKPYSSELDDLSTFELRRLADLTRRNPTLQFEIQVHQNQYIEDSVVSNPDLTEVFTDSVLVEKEVIVPVLDSLASNNVDSVLIDEADSVEYDDAPITMKKVKVWVKRNTYHNDRTQQQGEAIKSYLVERGGKADNITISTSKQRAAKEMEEGEDAIKVKIKIKRL